MPMLRDDVLVPEGLRDMADDRAGEGGGWRCSCSWRSRMALYRAWVSGVGVARTPSGEPLEALVFAAGLPYPAPGTDSGDIIGSSGWKEVVILGRLRRGSDILLGILAL